MPKVPSTRDVLINLKRRVGKERARYDRFLREASGPLARERAHGEATVCTVVMGMIDSEIRKLEG